MLAGNAGNRIGHGGGDQRKTEGKFFGKRAFLGAHDVGHLLAGIVGVDVVRSDHKMAEARR